MMKKALLVAFGLVVAAPAWAQHEMHVAAASMPAAGAATLAEPQRRGGSQAPPISVPWNDAIPPGTAEHAERALRESSRHGEWVDIALSDGTALRSWVVYPERPDRAGVVLVIHDIRGMSDLARAAADQLAQDGFIAIAPDFLSGKGPGGGGTEALGGGVGQAIMGLSNADKVARLNAAMEYGRTLPASNGKTAVIGFCWGGASSFLYASAQPELDAAVVYYGDAPGASDNTLETALADVRAPVLGLYAGNDARIGATVPPTQAAMQKLGKRYEVHTYQGAGHGFMFSQAGAGGANLRAAEQSWPLVVQFLTENLR